MKVAILSDIHDNIWNLEKVVEQIRGAVEAVIYCGDFCAPFSAGLLAELNTPIHACFGNNDEDHVGILKRGGENFKQWVALTEEYGTIELDNRKIAFCHYPKLAELLAKTGEYDAVFHGHNHEPKVETHDDTLFANPGAVCGIQDSKPGKASYGMYDTESNEIELIEIK